jgi:hypothetical protein
VEPSNLRAFSQADRQIYQRLQKENPLSTILFYYTKDGKPNFQCSVLFYADDMKLFLPFSGFQDCLKIQSDWKFSYMLGGTMLDRVSSINDVGVSMDEKD